MINFDKRENPFFSKKVKEEQMFKDTEKIV